MFSHKRVERIKKASRSTSVTKIQVMGAVELPNGDVRHELFTLGVDNGRDYEPFRKQDNFTSLWLLRKR